jgi:hypothetical protein
MERMDSIGQHSSRRAQNAISQRQQVPHGTIRKLLTIMAESLQASVTDATFLTYSRGLDGFLLIDLEAAIAALCLRERPDGKTSFPSLPTIISEVQSQSRRRYERVRAEKDKEERAYVIAHPDEFVSLKEIFDCVSRIQAKRKAGAKIPIPDANASEDELDAYVSFGCETSAKSV